MGQVVQKKNPYFVGPSQTITTVTVEPEETTKTTTLGAPDVRTQEYVQRNVIDPLRRAYGVNPQGAITPFEALGYNPEEERKRREAERALNDRKRKENAWYNAFAVLGDSLTAALGGNVWQRQPNNIGAQANADNARLIAEQKVEDEANAAKLRAAGTAYADSVNKLIQNYLTQTTTTHKTGGSRTEVKNNTGESGYRYSSHVVGDNSNGNGSGGGRTRTKIVKLAKMNPSGQIVGYRTMTVPEQEANAYATMVQTVLQRKFERGELTNILTDLMNAGIYNPTATDPTHRWNADKILTNGQTFYDDALNTELSRLWTLSNEYDGRPLNLTSRYLGPVNEDPNNTTNGWGIVPRAENEFDDDFLFVNR